MPGFSPLEALRGVFAVCTVFISAVFFWRAMDGCMAFARSIRRRMVKVRRTQMIVYASIALTWIVQSISAGMIESPWPPSWAAVILTLAVIYTMCAISGIAIYQYMKWADFERTIGDLPLLPDPDVVGVQASIDARPIMHTLATQLTLVSGGLEELRLTTILDENASTQIATIETRVDAMITLHRQAQILIQSVSKDSPDAPGGVLWGMRHR